MFSLGVVIHWIKIMYIPTWVVSNPQDDHVNHYHVKSGIFNAQILKNVQNPHTNLAITHCTRPLNEQNLVPENIKNQAKFSI